MTGPCAGATARHSVVVEGLWKELGSRLVLAGIDFEIPPGQVLALLGPNGAEKTTYCPWHA